VVMIILLLHLYSFATTETPEFYFNKKVALFSQMLENTRLKGLKYRPYWLSPTPFL